jgi:hypothetical protein
MMITITMMMILHDNDDDDHQGIMIVIMITIIMMNSRHNSYRLLRLGHNLHSSLENNYERKEREGKREKER